MAIEQINRVKQNKRVHVWDVIAFGLIALLIGGAFLCSHFLFSDTDQLTGVRFLAEGKEIALYSFDDGLYDPDGLFFETKSGNAVTLRLTLKSGTNVFEVDSENRKIKAVDSDCSSHKDCTYMSIANSAQSIVCLPHRLIVLPITSTLPDHIQI